MKDVVEYLQACLDDPMWADHAEITKATLRRTIAEITRLRAQVAATMGESRSGDEQVSQWKLVPVEPTKEQVEAGRDRRHIGGLTKDVYQAMLAAAPEPAQEPVAAPPAASESERFTADETLAMLERGVTVSTSVAPQDERDEILRDFIAAFEAAHGNVSSPWGLIVERARAALSPDNGGK